MSETIQIPHDLAFQLAWEHRDGSKLTHAIEELRALLAAAPVEAPETERRPAIFDRYPVGTIFQKKFDGRVLAMPPDTGITEVAIPPDDLQEYTAQLRPLGLGPLLPDFPAPTPTPPEDSTAPESGKTAQVELE